MPMMQPGENSLRSNTLEIIIKAKNLTGNAFKTISKGLDGLKSNLFSLKAAFLGVGTAIVAKNVIETKNEFVRYQKTLETLTGSMTKAKQVWEELLVFAEETPFKIAEVMDSYKTLKAFGLDPTIRTMRILGDTASALGGGDVLGRIALVLGQIRTQGFMSAQDMNQLANAGINAGKVMKDTFGAARDKVKQLKDQGVSVNMIINALLKNMKEKFGDQMAAMNKELSGQWEMLVSIWERFTVSIMDSGLYEYLKQSLTLINEQIIKLRADGTLKKWAKEIGETVVSSFEKILLSLAGFWDIAKPILSHLKTAITSVWDWFRGLPTWVQEAGLVVAILGGIQAKLAIAFIIATEKKIKDLTKTMKEYKALGGTGGFLDAKKTKKEQLADTEKQITNLKEQIYLQTKLIEQNKKDRDGWRGKILGQKVYQEQLEKNRKILKAMQGDADLSKLFKRKLTLETIIASPKTDEEATKDALAALGIPSSDALDDELSETQKKIQALFKKIRAAATKSKKEADKEKDTDKKKDTIPQAGVPLSAIGKQKSILTRMLADNTLFSKKLEQLFENGKKTVGEYYNEQIKHSNALYDEKRKLLKLELEKAKTIDEKKAIEDTLYTLEKTHQVELIDLAQQRTEAEDELLQKKKDAAALLQDIKDRAADSGGFGLESQFDRETAEMEARHAEELDRLTELTDAKADINDAARAQELEKEKLLQKQKNQIKEQELAVTAQVAGGMANIMGQAYELTGKKAKAFFYAQKAFAVAEAIINANLAATKVMSQGGVFAIPLSAMIYAQAMMNVAMITAQTVKGYAAGGEIQGYSSSKTADNIRINATAGEYMQPVDIVKHYGLRAMEAIRLKLVPREALNALISGFSLPSPDTSYKMSYATGGQVTPQAGGQTDSEINIVNIIDPRDIDSYMSSSIGSDAVLNIISSKARSVNRLLRD